MDFLSRGIGVAGVAGAVWAGVFATNTVNSNGADGFLAVNPAFLGGQAIAVLAMVAFAGIGSFAIVRALRLVISLRIPVDAEIAGIDISEHGEEAYHGSDLSDLTGRSTSIGDSVVLPACEMYGARARTHK